MPDKKSDEETINLAAEELGHLFVALIDEGRLADKSTKLKNRSRSQSERTNIKIL